MKLRLVAVGTRMPRWVREAFADYSGRMPAHMPLELVEIPVVSRSRNADLARLKAAEGQHMLRTLGRDEHVVALDERGTPWTTADLVARLEHWRHDGRDVALLIGGPDGLSAECLHRADARWSLSPLTLPHALVRVLLAEALYRAWSVLASHPYHRA